MVKHGSEDPIQNYCRWVDRLCFFFYVGRRPVGPPQAQRRSASLRPGVLTQSLPFPLVGVGAEAERRTPPPRPPPAKNHSPPAKNRPRPAFPGESTPLPTSLASSWMRAPSSPSRLSSLRGRDPWIRRPDPAMAAPLPSPCFFARADHSSSSSALLFLHGVGAALASCTDPLHPPHSFFLSAGLSVQPRRPFLQRAPF